MNIRILKILGITIIVILLSFSCRKSDIIIEDSTSITDDGSGTGTVTWTKDKEYLLDGFVFVNPGQTLTIEAGTVIRAKTGQGESASALIVARGGKITANGTYGNPIVFTSILDDGSLPTDTSGLWGGIIILGSAPINTDTGEGFIEGIPVSEARGQFGGSNEADNSGSLEFKF